MPTMSNGQRVFKQLLARLPGLRINTAEDLFLSEPDRLLVVSSLTGRHPSQGPDQFLNVETLHDKLLELMDACHNERQGMWMRSRMEPRLWGRVRASTSWAGNVNENILRSLALGLTQAAWVYFKNPIRDHNGAPHPWSKLAIAALRFADDITKYESHLNRRPDDVFAEDFAQFRGPIYLPNGKRLLDRNRRPVTQPVFPIYNYMWASRGGADRLPAGWLNMYYDMTQEEPEEIKALPRV